MTPFLPLLASFGLLAFATTREERYGAERLTTPPPTRRRPEGPSYVVGPLPWPADAFEPSISAQTNRWHHDDLAIGYERRFSKILSDWDKRRLSRFSPLSDEERSDLAWNLSGAMLHEIFFKCLAPPPHSPSPAFVAQMKRDFGSLDALAEAITDAAKTLHGNGWVVLVWVPQLSRSFVIQIRGHLDGWIPGAIPILPIDLWEHAYYRDHGPNRLAYLSDLWSFIDWTYVSRRLAAAMAR